MLADCPYVIVPLFKCARLNAEWVSKLNPLNKEHNIVLEKLGVANGWMTPCFISPIFPGITDVKAIIRRVKGYCNLIWLENS
jgi:hypothetical protein